MFCFRFHHQFAIGSVGRHLFFLSPFFFSKSNYGLWIVIFFFNESESELLLVTCQMTFIHRDLWDGKLVPSSGQRSKLSYFILCTFSGWNYRIWKGIPTSNGLREEESLVNISSCSGDLKCQRVMISSASNWNAGSTLWTFVQEYKPTVSPPFLERLPS